MTERPTFELGLVMAGAVSAGAYTAGVIDFFFEALDAIEDVRAGRPTSYLKAGLAGEGPIFDPPHGVRIKAVSGTSAGAMVTAIAATVLGTRVPPVNYRRDVRSSQPADNPLYDAWVQQIHSDKLLDRSDLTPGNRVLSLLNAGGLDEIVQRALKYADTDSYTRAYLSDAIPIYLCVGNLRGVRYSLRLSAEKGVSQEHQMSMHADYIGFCFHRDPKHELQGLRSLTPGAKRDAWKLLGDAALASGAFPVGLSARRVARDFTDYTQRRWFDPGAPLDPERKQLNGRDVDPATKPSSWRSRAGKQIELQPLDGPKDFPEGRYDFVNVDGGVFNNEPLELCRVALAGEGRNPRDPEEASRAVLMIDPFPNMFALDRSYDPVEGQELIKVLRNLAAAVVSQARFKPDELALARDPNVASRFAIMPIRYAADDKPVEHAIACGALAGFSGFFSKWFRHHDYMLGRRNCQRFLSHHFVLPADPGLASNPIMQSWTDATTRDGFKVMKRIKVADGGQKVEREVVHLPIIPLLGKLASPDYTRIPPWPSNPPDLSLPELRQSVIGRADELKSRLVDQYKPSPAFRLGIETFWRLKRKEWVDRFVMSRINRDLRQTGLLH